MKNQLKKHWKKFFLSAFLIGTTVTATSVTLAACSSDPKVNVPTTNASSFSSLTKSILPTIAGVLTANDSRNTLISTFVKELLLNWFGSVNEERISSKYKDWKEDAEKLYKDQYKEYEKNKGKYWKQLFQSEVLDPVGGTKEDYINTQINSNLKTAFVDLLFDASAKNYLAYKETNNSTDTITSVYEFNPNELFNIDNTYVNGTNAGDKNNFLFSDQAVPSQDRKTIDAGYADFMEFLMDDWIKNAMPLPITMSLWKNGTNKESIKQLFSQYFIAESPDNTIPDGYESGNYKFQYFEKNKPGDFNKLSTTSKFTKLIQDLNKGSYVSKTTGLTMFNKAYTEDESNFLIADTKQLFDGTYVTPFGSAAWYKFGKEVFDISDSNVPKPTNLDSSSIMKNFLYFGNTNPAPTNKEGVFEFPYPTTWRPDGATTNMSVFLGEYEGATGIKDILDLSALTNIDNNTLNTNSKLKNYILVRNEFGVHLVGIDRLDKIKEAINGTSDISAKLQKVQIELRNTFMYYYAVDSTQSEPIYNVKARLQSYLTDNFEKVIFEYIKKVVDKANDNQNNLFGAKITMNKNDVTDFSNNFGFQEEYNGKKYKNYYTTLNEIKNGTNDNKLRKLLDSAALLQKVNSLKTFNESIVAKIYANQEAYNNNNTANKYVEFGIAGGLPFTRGNNGQFTHLVNFANQIAVSLVKDITLTAQSKPTENNKLSFNNVPSQITPQNVDEAYKKAKYHFAQEMINWLNSLNLVISPRTTTGINTYLFTSNKYVNNALLAAGSNGELNSIFYNSYMQGYAKQEELDSLATEETEIWNNLLDSFSRTYLTSKFFSDNNQPYLFGDWTNYTQFNQIIDTFWKDKFVENEFEFTIKSDNTDVDFTTYSKPTDSEELFNFLIYTKYLLSWNSTTKKFEWNNLQKILQDVTQVTNSSSGKAMVAWQNMSSVLAQIGNNDFGITSSMSKTNLQTRMLDNTKFRTNPLHLLKTNSYSWYNSKNPYDIYKDSNTKDNISFSNNASYWVASPIKAAETNQDNYNTGYLGFQFENLGQTGLTNTITTAAFENSTYANGLGSTVNEEVKYRGMFYSFESRTKMAEHVQTLSTPNLLTTFYNNNLANSGLPVTMGSRNKIKEILESTKPDRTTKLQQAIKTIVENVNEVPDAAFAKMDGMPLWNKDNNISTTLFEASDGLGDAYKNQYIISQFNAKDVQELFTETNGKLSLATDKYLGLNKAAFYDAIVMMAMNSKSIQQLAVQQMQETIGKVSIFDIRLVGSIDKIWIANFDEWSKVQNLGS